MGEHSKKKYMKRRTAIITVGAIIVMCIGAVAVAFQGSLFNKDGSKKPSSTGGKEYMSYQGPILPITAIDEIQNIRVERELIFDFDYLKAESRAPFLLPYNVKDSYIIANDTDEDRRVRFCYPSIGKMSYMANFMPYIAIDGVTIGTSQYVGASLSEEKLSTWAQYKEVLSDDDYFNGTFEKSQNIECPVTVYEFSNEKGETEGAGTAALAVDFKVKDKNSKLLIYGFKPTKSESKEGRTGVCYSVPPQKSIAYGSPRYLIVVGEDVEDLKLQGYRDDSCQAGTEIKVSADINKYETTLGEIVGKSLAHYNSIFNNKTDVKTVMFGISQENLVEAIVDLLENNDDRMTSEGGSVEFTSLEDVIGKSLDAMRIFYQTFTVEIPAKSSVKVDAVMFKEPSPNSLGEDKTAEKIFEVATQLGSNVKFSSQRATAKNWDNVAVTNQDFGFDIENDVVSVTLEEGKEHFFLGVKENE